MTYNDIDVNLNELYRQRNNLTSSADSIRDESELNWVNAMISDIDNRIDELNRFKSGEKIRTNLF